MYVSSNKFIRSTTRAIDVPPPRLIVDINNLYNLATRTNEMETKVNTVRSAPLYDLILIKKKNNNKQAN